MWQYTCGLTTAGEAWCWGDVAGAPMNGAPPERFAPDLSFASLTAGWYQVCAITPAGKAWCWGFNDKGQLGTGTPDGEFHDEPRPVAGDHTFTDISSGVGHVCGVTVAAEIWCWGTNGFGQLGNGSTENSAVPVRVSGGLAFNAVSAGDLHTCGLTPSSEVWCWGNNGIAGLQGDGGVLPGGDERYILLTRKSERLTKFGGMLSVQGSHPFMPHIWTETIWHFMMRLLNVVGLVAYCRHGSMTHWKTSCS
jgi:hypothetical protein